jgi:hypothetical protein
MADKLAFATSHKDLTPKPNSNYLYNEGRLLVGPAIKHVVPGLQPKFKIMERNYLVYPDAALPVFTPTTTGGIIVREGSDEEWKDYVLLQNGLFSGFPRYSPRGEIWDGTSLEDWDLTATTNDYGEPTTFPNFKYNLVETDSIAVGPGTDYVGPFSIEEATEIYWRVKKWTVWKDGFTGSYKALITDGDYGTRLQTIDQSSGQMSTQNPAITNSEVTAHLVGMINSSCQKSHSHIGDSLPVGVPVGAGISLSFNVKKSLPVVSLKSDPTKYYIPMEISLSGINHIITLFVYPQDGDGPEYENWTGADYAVGGESSCAFGLRKPLALIISDLSDNTSPPSHSYIESPGAGVEFFTSPPIEPTAWYYRKHITEFMQISLKLPNGRVLQIPLYGYQSKGFSGEYQLTGGPYHFQNAISTIGFPSFGAVTIEPLEYWPYDDGNGNPIWDKDTGEMLRDPVTGVPVTA